ncbi:MAG: hypothetical protein WCY11_16795 [Novosphingobium sp.]
MLPKKGRMLPPWDGLARSAKDYAQLIADALRQEHGNTHRAVKTIMRWTGASERSVKNWLSGEFGPSGYFLMRLCVTSPAVRGLVMELLTEPDMVAPSRGDGSIESVAAMSASADSCLPECAVPEANRDTIRDIIRDIDVPNRHLLNDRQLWFLTRVATGDRCLAADLAAHWRVSEKTARRDIALLKGWGLIQYVGTLRRGRYVGAGSQ